MGGSWLQTTKRRDGSAGAIASRSAGRDASILRWSSGSCACRFARSIVGFLILDYTPQAQDLFTEFADSYVRIAVFLVLLTTVWAATTHYAARLLLDTDMRFRAYADPRVWTYLGSFERWVPRLLGLIPFAVVLIASERSIFNLPHIEDKDVTCGHHMQAAHFRCACRGSRRGVPCLHGEASGSDGDRPGPARGGQS